MPCGGFLIPQDLPKPSVNKKLNYVGATTVNNKESRSPTFNLRVSTHNRPTIANDESSVETEILRLIFA